MSQTESLRDLLQRWRNGDQAAAAEIYGRYEERLVELADRRIGGLLRPKVQPESVMLMVLESVLNGIAEGKYSVHASGALWGLMIKVTDNKIRKKWEAFVTQKRDVRKELRLDTDGPAFQLISEAPSPEAEVALADQLDMIRSRLKPSDFDVFDLQLQGYSCPEIVQRLGCARQTVRLRVNRVEKWLREQASGDFEE